MISFIGFIICCAVIFFTGKKLSWYGNIIAELTGMGRSWVGLILLATVTTLPELFVGFSASAIIQSADLAVGNVMGSCAINLGILAMMDAFVPDKKVLFSEASRSNTLTAGMFIILMALVGAGLLLPYNLPLTPGIGFINIFFILIFLLSIRIIFKYEKKYSETKEISNDTSENITLKKALVNYIIFALITVAAALLVPHFVKEIAELTGLSETFAGTLFLAISTSLPEIAISLSAVQRGHIDLVTGDLLGANLFNIFILALNDIFYTKGQILQDASDANIISVFATILMSSIAIIGFIYKFKNKPWGMAWDSMLIFGIYLINMLLLYDLSR
jgi:cation:H+ antiporter